MTIIIPANSAADAGYTIANSCRFNSGDSPSLKDGDGSAPAGNRQKFTFSVWFKRAKLGVTQMFGASAHSSSDEGYLYISGGDVLVWHHTDTGMGQMITNQKFRDVGAWYHLVWSVDTTQATAGNRMKFYINGTQITSWATETQPDEDKEIYWNVGGTYYPWIGRRHGGDYFDGYMAEVVHIDNAQLAATSFGEFNSDSPTIWQPIDVSGLTFGTAGYWLDFEDSSALGNDVSGNGNHFGTVANLAATDQATDTPTNNFCTWNPLDNYYANSTFSEGNLQLASGGTGDETYNTSTFGLTAGKWYCELKHTGGSSTPYRQLFGIAQKPTDDDGQQLGGDNDDSWGYYDNDGKIRHNNSDVIGYNTWTQNDIIGLALDLDNNRLYFSKNGTWENSSNPEDGTNPISIDSGFTYFIAWGDATTHSNYCQVNFGNPVHSISSGNSDANGYGNFEYAVPSGYYALCTKNLAEFG